MDDHPTPWSTGRMARLPEEVVIKVLLQVGARNVTNCRLVCKHLKALIDSSVAIQFMVQLELSGYEDGPWIQNSPPSSSSSRLTALREHLTNWSTLNWKEVEISVPQFSTYELGGGVFAIGHGDRVLFVELPSQLRGIESRMWEHGPLEFELHGLTMDREQDLLGLLEWSHNIGGGAVPTIHLRTLSTNEPHPHAAQKSLPMRGGPRFSHSEMHVMEDKLGCLCSVWALGEGEEHLQIWNWITGESLAFWTWKDLATSFCFVSPTGILVPYSSAGDYGVHVLDISHHDDISRPQAYPAGGYQYLFPPCNISDRSRITVIGSTPMQPKSGDLAHQTGCTAPFRMSPDRFVHLEWNLTINGNERVARRWTGMYDLVAPMSIFETSWRDAHALNTGKGTIPWESWGPQNTRFSWYTRTRRPNHFECHISGGRHVFVDGLNITLHDYHPVPRYIQPWGTKSSVMSDGEDHLSHVSQRRPFSMEDDQTFMSPVETMLPFTETRRRPPDHWSSAIMSSRGVMCDEERIIFVNTSEEQTSLLVLMM